MMGDNLSFRYSTPSPPLAIVHSAVDLDCSIQQHDWGSSLGYADCPMVWESNFDQEITKEQQ